MTEKTRCEICDRTFKDMEGLAAHNKAKHAELIERSKKQLSIKKISSWSIIILIAGLVIAGIIFGISGIGRLPPTDMQGHIESNPPARILKEPMSLAIQKHMLEHADGIEKGRGGVIINYNCVDYECEDTLIEKLESFATRYDYVYVAPFKGMDAKIALTSLNKIEVLEEFNNETIERFINY